MTIQKFTKVVTEDDVVQAKKLMRKIARIGGEKRVIYKCTECGTLFGCRFIPYGLGRGFSINMCLCQLTANRMHNTVIVLERKP
jgi:hypothetical protein